jgi:hypothetical protein
MRVNDSHLKEEELEACYSLAALSGKICDHDTLSAFTFVDEIFVRKGLCL